MPDPLSFLAAFRATNLEPPDPDEPTGLERSVTPAGMILDGTLQMVIAGVLLGVAVLAVSGPATFGGKVAPPLVQWSFAVVVGLFGGVNLVLGLDRVTGGER